MDHFIWLNKPSFSSKTLKALHRHGRDLLPARNNVEIRLWVCGCVKPKGKGEEKGEKIKNKRMERERGRGCVGSTCPLRVDVGLPEGGVAVGEAQAVMRAWTQALELVERLRGVHLLRLLPFTTAYRHPSHSYIPLCVSVLRSSFYMRG